MVAHLVTFLVYLLKCKKLSEVLELIVD